MPPIDIPLFGYVALTEAINAMQPVNTFIKSHLFPNEKTHTAKSVLVDIIVGKKKIAPFVNSGDPAKVVGKLGQKSQLITPPNIRIKKDLTADDLLLSRGAGFPIFVPGGSGDPIDTARKKRIADEQKDMLDLIERTSAFMCCQALAGGFTITQDDVSFSIDYQMPLANKPALTGDALWTAPTTAKPLSNLRAWKTQVSTSVGKMATELILSTTLWNYFINTDEVKSQLNMKSIEIGNVKTEDTLLKAGAEKKARIENVDIYTYDATYTDAYGNEQRMIPEDRAVLTCKDTDSKLHYGMIQDLKAANVIGKYFSKDWIQEDPSVYWLLAESHPLPVKHRPEDTVFAKVI